MAGRTNCPHCSAVMSDNPTGIGFSPPWEDRAIIADEDGYIGLNYQLSPCCNRYVVHIVDDKKNRHLVWPNYAVIQPISELVPAKYAGDFQEARAVLPISPKASAALSRRCLHYILEDEAGANGSWSLEKQIEHANAATPPLFPPRLAERLQHIRIIGKFAAHPKKNTNTGEIIDVEPDEAEYLLEVLGEVFVHLFIEPVKDATRRSAIARKEADARKPAKS